MDALVESAEKLSKVIEIGKSRRVQDLIEGLENAVKDLEKSWSGSTLGYHSHVYYEDYIPAPAGAHFSQEWGLMDVRAAMLGTSGNWQEYLGDDVRTFLFSLAGNPDLKWAQKEALNAIQVFEDEKSEIVSCLQVNLAMNADPFLSELLKELNHLEVPQIVRLADDMIPKGQVISRDSTAVSQGHRLPPHREVYAEVQFVRISFKICERAQKIAIRAISHIERKESLRNKTEKLGTKIFIGHGGSKIWKDLKEFVCERLKLPYDEFNRVPVAGITNIARLIEMLNGAAFAFIVLTAEDETAEGKFQARMNAIHEVGLFQGKLGFERAIILLENGCEEFSNIQGLGQIRFPKGNIGAIFEDVRKVLEREKLISEQ